MTGSSNFAEINGWPGEHSRVGRRYFVAFRSIASYPLIEAITWCNSTSIAKLIERTEAQSWPVVNGDDDSRWGDARRLMGGRDINERQMTPVDRSK